MGKPDPLEGFCADAALAGLFGFQRDAVEHAFHRLYVAEDSTRRFLVADEVGLGKTMIARGVLARTLEHLRDHVARIDVVYICSNLSIARQNIDRLNPMKDYAFADAERITMLPTKLKSIADHRVNFVAFTPSTSLELSSSLGMMRERIVLHEMLRPHWNLQGTGPMNVLQGVVRNTDYFRHEVVRFRNEGELSSELLQAFRQALDEEERSSAANGRPSLRARFMTLADGMRRTRSTWTAQEKSERAALIGALRGLLARVCIGALQPDLVILDEFQRFKDLLGGGDPEQRSEAAELAEQLFSWSSGHEATRVLLLSATPYKAYTLQHELAQDDHYADFLRTVEFLDNDQAKNARLKELLETYQRELYRLGDGDTTRLVDLKGRIEDHLRRVMSRTERLTSSFRHNGMLRTVMPGDVTVTADDLSRYVGIRHLTDALEVGDAIEYWKSAAYPLNFMDGYEFRHTLDEALAQGPSQALREGLMQAAPHTLDFKAIEAYEPVPLPNARLRSLANQLYSLGAHQALWLPPSLPSYRLGGGFAHVSQVLSKRLIFSAWNLVPRSLAALLSYEFERLALKADDPQAVNTEAFRKGRRGLLRFAKSENRLTGLPLLALFYPSHRLAELCDPRDYVRKAGHTGASLEEVLAWATDRIRAGLPDSIEFAGPGEAADESWYWLSSLLLDAADRPEELREWWDGDHFKDESEESGDPGEVGHWSEHVAHARDLFKRRAWPVGKAPVDLLNVLALIGVAGPATSALRALLRVQPVADGAPTIRHRTAAARIGLALRGLLNRPESIGIIRRGNPEPYWKQVLQYCADGCFAAVIEEYVHLLHEAELPSCKEPDEACGKVAEGIEVALTLRSANLDVDRFERTVGSNQVELKRPTMRTMFAVRFSAERKEDEKNVQRVSAVREAFNSPFWPFVLVSTSVGQEGLDFHTYCHTVVHWNVPTNPVDLEQREGRVQRFKGHAVRKNVATVHGREALVSAADDPWKEAFQLALRDAPGSDRGLYPYWLYPLEEGAFVERHVPLFALSKDQVRYHDVVRSLGAYRMVFGQPRQDELLAYLLKFLPPGELEKCIALLRMDLAPPRALGTGRAELQPAPEKVEPA